MESLPLFHRLAGQPVLVVGEGEAAAAKARLIQEAGGIVVQALQPGVRLAFVALDDGAEAVAEELRAAGLLVNVVDRPALCDFTVPAIIDRAPVTVAVGTAGASASLSKALKERLEVILPPGLGRLAEAIRNARAAVAARYPRVADRRDLWAALLAPGAPLDPLAAQADPAATIAAALASDASATAAPELHEVRLQAPRGAAHFDVDSLPLGVLRLLAQADLVVLPADAPAALGALIRRDAARHEGDAPPADAGGRIVWLRFDAR